MTYSQSPVIEAERIEQGRRIDRYHGRDVEIGYCIDAPRILPAGSTVQGEIFGLPVPNIALRPEFGSGR